MLGAIIESMRPKQWIKNFIIFAPLAFAQKLTDPAMVAATVVAFISFCLASSGVYLLNDILDREADRHHPDKMNRPIASGRLGIGPAVFSMVFIFMLSGGLAFYISSMVPVIVASYVGLNLLYSYKLKHFVIIDAFCIAFGFILRMLAGGEAIRGIDPSIEISHWIILCTLLGSLFLAFCKRRNELMLAESAADHRASLAEYGTRFLDQMIAISTACTVMAYSLWTIWPGTMEKFQTGKLFWTVPFVCYGIFRYLYLVHQKNMGGSPSRVFLSDVPLIVNIFLWFLAVVAILYEPAIRSYLG